MEAVMNSLIEDSMLGNSFRWVYSTYSDILINSLS
jgi:hypothetical protein